jgi:hypothetical protein
MGISPVVVLVDRIHHGTDTCIPAPNVHSEQNFGDFLALNARSTLLEGPIGDRGATRHNRDH